MITFHCYTYAPNRFLFIRYRRKILGCLEVVDRNPDAALTQMEIRIPPIYTIILKQHYYLQGYVGVILLKITRSGCENHRQLDTDSKFRYIRIQMKKIESVSVSAATLLLLELSSLHIDGITNTQLVIQVCYLAAGGNI